MVRSPLEVVTTPLSELKTTSAGLAVLTVSTGSERKCLLFKKILKEEFLREMEYLCDVVNNRAKARDTMAEILVKQLKDLTSYIPSIGSTAKAVIEQLGSLVVFAPNRLRDERTKMIARLQEDLDLHHLEILLDLVVQEALRRYEDFIVNRLSDHPEKGVIPFARVGARRMLENLSRSVQQQDGKLVLNESTLLAGLMEGRSGAWIEGFSNHTLELKQTKINRLGKLKNKTIVIEDVYARPGLRHFEVQGTSMVDQLYIREKAKHQDSSAWKDLFKGKTDVLYNFGYVRFRKTSGYRQDPVAGYVFMPLPVIKDRYDFKRQDRKVVSTALQTELSQFSPSILCINRSTLTWYLSWMRASSQQDKRILDYVHEKLKFPHVTWVVCHDDLSELDLKGANLSYIDLSGATVSGDLTGTRFDHSYLIGTTLKSISSMRDASFYQTRCEFLSAEGVNFSGADLTQTCFDYANLYQAKLADCKTLGAKWRGANIEGITTDTEVEFEQKNQMIELRSAQVKERQRLREVYRFMQQQAANLQDLQKQLAAKVTEFSDRLGSDEETKQTLNQLTSEIQRLIEQQEDTLTFQRHCQEEMTQLSKALDFAVQPEKQKQLQEQIKALQQQLTELTETKKTILLTALKDKAPEQSAFIEAIEFLEKQFNQTLMEQQQVQATQTKQLITSLNELQQSLDKRLEEKFKGLVLWANQTFQELTTLKIEYQATQQHLVVMQQELQQLKQQQQTYQQEQKNYRQELNIYRSQLEHNADAKGLEQVRNRLKTLDGKLVENTVGLVEEKAVSARLDALQQSCIHHKKELEQLVSERSELRGQYEQAIVLADQQAKRFEQLKQEFAAQQLKQAALNKKALEHLTRELTTVKATQETAARLCDEKLKVEKLALAKNMPQSIKAFSQLINQYQPLLSYRWESVYKRVQLFLLHNNSVSKDNYLLILQAQVFNELYPELRHNALIRYYNNFFNEKKNLLQQLPQQHIPQKQVQNYRGFFSPSITTKYHDHQNNIAKRNVIHGMNSAQTNITTVTQELFDGFITKYSLIARNSFCKMIGYSRMLTLKRLFNEPNKDFSQRTCLLAFFIKYGALPDESGASGFERNSARMILMKQLGLKFSKEQLKRVPFNELYDLVRYQLTLHTLLQPLAEDKPSVDFTTWLEDTCNQKSDMIDMCIIYTQSIQPAQQNFLITSGQRRKWLQSCAQKFYPRLQKKDSSAIDTRNITSYPLVNTIVSPVSLTTQSTQPLRKIPELSNHTPSTYST